MTFRFTIRDVLWLMVVVGMACALVLTMRKNNALRDERKALRDKLESVEWLVEQRDEEYDAFTSELEKITGKRFRGMTLWSDPSGDPQRSYKIIYDENQEPTQSATETP